MLHPDVSQQLLISLRIGVRERRFVPMCRLYRRWFNGAQPGDVETLISRCPGELRNHLLVLLRDLLMQFPRVIFGIPCLVQHRWSDPLDGDLFAQDSIALPEVTGKMAEPLPGLQFIGWAKPGSALTSTGGQPMLDAVSVTPGGSIGAIALLKASDEGLVYRENANSAEDGPWLAVPDIWWGRLMAEVPGSLVLQTHRLMPYPEAVEATRIMCDVAGVERFRLDRPNFVRQLDIEQVREKARHFKLLQAQS